MLKFAAHVVPVTVSTALVVILGSLLPAPAAWLIVLAGPAITAALLLGWGEGAATRIVHGTRDLTPTEQLFLAPTMALLNQHGFSAPTLELTVQAHTSPAVQATAVGRRTVVLSTGLVDAARHQLLPPAELAAVIGHAAGIARAGAVRNDLALAFWTLPWSGTAVLGHVIYRGLWVLRPIFRAAWPLRVIVASVAIAQSINQGHPVVAVLVAGILAATYAHPWAVRAWRRRLQDLGDHAVMRVGLGAPMATFLRRLPASPRLDERTYRLDQAPTPVATPSHV